MPDKNQSDKKRIVVIGAGAAGVFTGYLLQKRAPDAFDITILEQLDQVGGNTRGETFEYQGEKIHIDCGAQFFSETSEPDYCNMLREEGFFDEEGMVVQSNAGMTVWNATSKKLEFKVPSEAKELWKSVEDPANWLDWANFLALTVAAVEKYSSGDWTESFGHWIDRVGFVLTHHEKKEFKKKIARPLLYEFGLVPPAQLDDLSARFVIYYYVGSLPWPHAGAAPKGPKPPKGGIFSLYTCKIGMDGVLDTLIERYGLNVQLNTAVDSIAKQGDGYVVAANGKSYPADEIVFATNPMWTHGLVPGDPEFASLRALLADMAYAKEPSGSYGVPIVIQQGESSYMPTDPKDWNISNVSFSEEDHAATHYMMTVWFGPLKSQPIGKHFFKSWGSPELDPPDQPNVHVQTHQLMVGTPEFMAKREELRTTFQGLDNLWFAGGYILEYDTQNTCLKSATNVVGKLIHRYAPIAAEAEGLVVSAEDLPELELKGLPPLISEIEHKILDKAHGHPLGDAFKALRGH